jgi:hypothetical protein
MKEVQKLGHGPRPRPRGPSLFRAKWGLETQTPASAGEAPGLSQSSFVRRNPHADTALPDRRSRHFRRADGDTYA